VHNKSLNARSKKSYVNLELQKKWKDRRKDSLKWKLRLRKELKMSEFVDFNKLRKSRKVMK